MHNIGKLPRAAPGATSASNRPVMGNFLATPAAQAVLWTAVALVMTVVAVYFLLRLRDRAKGEESTVDHLTNFREMRHRGVLDDAEFRTIKTVLGERLRKEITDSESTT